MIDTSKFGGFNDPPPNLTEMSEKEWAQSTYFSIEALQKEFRQFSIKDVSGKEIFHNFYLYYVDEHSGYAITNEYWQGRVRAFRFGCQHIYSELSFQECREKDLPHFGSHYHVSECKNCGHIMAYDSSG